jgi:hypothetical protein
MDLKIAAFNLATFSDGHTALDAKAVHTGMMATCFNSPSQMLHHASIIPQSQFQPTAHKDYN